MGMGMGKAWRPVSKVQVAKQLGLGHFPSVWRVFGGRLQYLA